MSLSKDPCSLTPLGAALMRWKNYKREVAWNLSRACGAYTRPRTLANYDFRLPGAYYPRLRSDADEQIECEADVSTRACLQPLKTSVKNADTIVHYNTPQ